MVHTTYNLSVGTSSSQLCMASVYDALSNLSVGTPEVEFSCLWLLCTLPDCSKMVIGEIYPFLVPVYRSHCFVVCPLDNCIGLRIHIKFPPTSALLFFHVIRMKKTFLCTARLLPLVVICLYKLNKKHVEQ